MTKGRCEKCLETCLNAIYLQFQWVNIVVQNMHISDLRPKHTSVFTCILVHVYECSQQYHNTCGAGVLTQNPDVLSLVYKQRKLHTVHKTVFINMKEDFN